MLLIRSMDFSSFGAVTAGFCAEEAEKPVMKCKVIQGHCPDFGINRIYWILLVTFRPLDDCLVFRGGPVYICTIG